MWVAAHATCGAALGKWIRRPVLLASAAVASHIVLDWIPHWDYPARPVWGIVDLVIAVGLVALFCKPDRLAWWGAFWAVVPDLDVVLSFYQVVPRNVFPSHMGGFPHGQAGVVPGSILQILFILAFVLISRWLDSEDTASRGLVARENSPAEQG